MIFLFIGEVYYYWPPRYLSFGKRNYSISKSLTNKDFCSISHPEHFGDSVSGSANNQYGFKYNSQSLTGKN
jgi:hypothetical protein